MLVLPLHLAHLQVQDKKSTGQFNMWQCKCAIMKIYDTERKGKEVWGNVDILECRYLEFQFLQAVFSPCQFLCDPDGFLPLCDAVIKDITKWDKEGIGYTLYFGFVRYQNRETNIQDRELLISYGYKS
jgi:hypothetical protein